MERNGKKQKETGKKTVRNGKKREERGRNGMKREETGSNGKKWEETVKKMGRKTKQKTANSSIFPGENGKKQKKMGINRKK